jgi:hypothetical protein
MTIESKIDTVPGPLYEWQCEHCNATNRLTPSLQRRTLFPECYVCHSTHLLMHRNGEWGKARKIAKEVLELL